MKKIVLLILSISMFMCLVSCDILNQFIPQDPTPEHTHKFGEWSVTKKPTCTEDGINVRYCDCGEKQSENIPALSHSVVIDEAVAPTCTDAGKTEGKHCSICNQVIHAQSVVPMLSHTYGEWIVTKTANCGQDGEMTRFCSCGAKQTEVIYGAGMHTEIIDPAVNATCTQDGLTEGMHCSVCNTIIIAQNIIPASHRYSDEYEYNDEYHWLKCIDCGDENISLHNANDEGICSVCDKPIGATEGIIYDKSDDGTYAMVVGYTGIAKKVKIADTYQGLPVKTIYQNAFKDNNAITSVIIPDSVTSIGSDAFRYCRSLTSIVIPDSVTSIGSYAFAYCSGLTSVVIGDSVTAIDEYAFYCCSSLTSVVIGDSVTSIGYGAFKNCHSLTSVVIGDSVTSIGSSAFESCSDLTSVVIGDSVTSIGEWAFYRCFKIKDVYYTGSEEEWNVISMEKNYELTNATIHYNYVPEN